MGVDEEASKGGFWKKVGGRIGFGDEDNCSSEERLVTSGSKIASMEATGSSLIEAGASLLAEVADKKGNMSLIKTTCWETKIS